MFPPDRLRAAVDGFRGKTVLVVGDFIADEYVYGKPTRISREAPVIILRFLSRELRLGGAANASYNVHALGARVIPVGVVGADPAGDELLQLCRTIGIPTEGIARASGRPTPVKTRVMAGGYQSTSQQVVRVDREPAPGVDADSEAAVIDRVSAFAPTADAVILSDYGYGVLTGRIVDQVMTVARRSGGIVTADSRYDLLRFKSITAATPNEPELEGLVGATLDDGPALEKAGRQVLERLGCRYLLVTRGSRGMALFEREGPSTFLPIRGSDEIADVTGAGDTVISTFTLALAAGSAAVEAAWLANVAGGVVVMKRGTAPIARAELLEALASDGTPREP
jgi:rfaE bifunctional protein kinase chain/domain